VADFLQWTSSNGFLLFQTISIVAGLGFTAASLRQQARAKEFENILTLEEHHRELWNEASRRPELTRLLRPNIDLAREPATVAEEEFLNLVIVHFQTGWQMASAGTVLRKQTVEADAREFFRLPLPNLIWQRTKAFREERFVRFVEKTLAVRGNSQMNRADELLHSKP
jgi:hypothetical protein